MAAKILAASNDMDKAEKTIVKLTEQYPNDASVWRSFAVLRYQQGNTAAAMEAADRFEQISKLGPEAATLRAAILMAAKRPDDAIRVLSDQLASASPDQMPRVALPLFYLLNQAGKHPEAVAILRAHT